MLYHIQNLCPRREMSGAGFCVLLWPAWRDAVAARALTQDNADTAVETMGRAWLDGCGFDQIYDPDNSGFDRDKKKPPGPRAGPMYRPGMDLRVRWGEWGSEHITVPGNACGLDIDSHGCGKPKDGAILGPHNVDHIRQAHLLLVVFLFFADTLVLDQMIRGNV